MDEKMPWPKESNFSKEKRELEAQGFTFVGQESLTKFKFTEGARFIVVPLHTKEEIVQLYLDKYKNQGDVEIKLVDNEELDQKQKAVYVFIKKK